MGYGLGAAIGAKMGRPDKTVVNIAGDGCFRMNMNEIATAVRCHKQLLQIVMNNHVLGMVRQWQTLFYEHRYSHTVLDDAVDPRGSRNRRTCSTGLLDRSGSQRVPDGTGRRKSE